MKTTQTEEPLMRLQKALETLKADPLTSWMPWTRMRDAVLSGEVPSKRSSNAKRAWYYVRVSDLKKLFE